MIELGSIVKDRITGFEGVAIARTEWLHGCSRITVQPQGLHEGKPIAGETFDEPQIEVIKTENAERWMSGTVAATPTGGPRNDPVGRHRNPTR